MRLRHGKWSWSIRALLVSLAVLPPLAVLLLVVASTLATRMAELGAEMDQRGRLLASAISESSRYGVQAENREILERTLAALATSDRGIAELEIMNHQREVVASYRASVARRSDISFEEPVFPRVVAIDPNEVAGRAAGNDRQAIGYVRVKLTSEPMEAAKRKAIVVAIAFAALAALCGSMLGLMIARRIERPMRQVMAALEQIRQGRFAVKMGSEAPGELGDLQRSIVKMSADLSVVQTGLEAAVHERTMQLETAMEEKASLIANTHLALEHERKRIAQDIHDQLNPSVVAIQFAAAQLQPKQGKSTDPEKVRSVAQEISASATQVYDAARRIVRSLRPEVLDTLGFEAALTELVRSFNEMESGCEFRLEFGHDVPKISPDIAMTAYRVTQEAS